MTTQEQSSMLIADDLRRVYIRPFVMLFSLESSSPLLIGSGNSGGSHNPSDGGNSGHGSSGDGNDDGGNGHDPSTGEDIGDETPGKGWDFYWPIDE